MINTRLILQRQLFKRIYRMPVAKMIMLHRDIPATNGGGKYGRVVPDENDSKLIEDLLMKMKKQSNDIHQTEDFEFCYIPAVSPVKKQVKSMKAKHLDSLEEVFKKHGIANNSELMDALYDWKRIN